MACQKKTLQSKIECKQELTRELEKSSKELKELQKEQLKGDYSIEMSRRISILTYHIEVLQNRIDGNFLPTYRIDSELNVPKTIK